MKKPDSDRGSHLTLALSCAGMGTWEWNAPHGALDWDEQMHALFGIESRDFDGSYECFLSLIHPEDRERTLMDVNEAVQRRKEYDGEFRVIWPSEGSVHFLRMRFKVAAAASDASIHVAGVCWDVTERRRTEQQLSMTSNLFNVLMKSLPDHIYFKDRESRFIAVSRAKAARNKLDPEKMLGKTDFDYFSEEHARAAFQDEQRVLATGEPVIDAEEKETWPDGGVTWVSTTKLPQRDEKG